MQKLFLILILQSSFAWAQGRSNFSPINPVASRSPRLLAGHTFLPNSNLTFPFDVSQAGLSFGVAMATLTDASLDAPLQLIGFAPGIAIRLALHPVFFDLGVTSSIQLGSNGYSALIAGVQLSQAYRLGVGSVLLRRPHFVLSAVASIIHKEGIQVNPLVAGTRSITSLQGVNSSTFLVSSIANELYPRLVAAWALSREWGLLLESGPNFEFSSAGTVVQNIRAGAQIDFNLKPVLELPIGALAFYRADYRLNSPPTQTQIIGCGVFDMTSDHFNLGIEASWLVSASNSASIYVTSNFFY